MTEKVKWKCPACGAPAHGHGKGECEDPPSALGCDGFLCECEVFDRASKRKDHGSFTNPCENAFCYHCGWDGTFPQPPKKALPWEKKALAAGWAPPKGWKAE